MCSICDLRIAFGIGHPMSLSVAVATRRAIEAGLVPEAQDRGREGAIALMHGAQQRLERALRPAALAALPAFFVLLVETRLWAYFHPGPGRFDPSVQRAPPDAFAGSAEPVIVAAESALGPILEGRLPFARAVDAGLVHLDAPEAPRAALHAAFAEAWPAAFSRFVCA